MQQFVKRGNTYTAQPLVVRCLSIPPRNKLKRGNEKKIWVLGVESVRVRVRVKYEKSRRKRKICYCGESEREGCVTLVFAERSN